MTSLSYLSASGDEPLRYQTIGQGLAAAATQYPNHVALVARQQNRRLTWAELAQDARNLAEGMIVCGLAPGDRIGIWSPNCIEWVIVQLAAAEIGLILVSINPAYRLAELEFALNKVSCKALVMAARFKSSDYIAMLRGLLPSLANGKPGVIQDPRIPSLRQVILIGETTDPQFSNLRTIAAMRTSAANAERVKISAMLRPDDPINIQFTSGTTGLPKGATLSHHNILNNALFAARRQAITDADRICAPVPLYHCFGMVLGTLLAMQTGAALIFPSEGFDPEATLQTIAAERCTVLYGVPTMFIALLDHPRFQDYDLRSLRTGIMAGAPCPVEVMRRVIDDMYMGEITIGYGMTEISPLNFQSNRDDTLEQRVATVGRIHPHLEVKLVDPAGNTVPRGEAGEICTRGYSVMRGYWNDAAETAKMIDEAGWIHSGDLGVIDIGGYCQITGRLKDLIIRGGENIAPREIEEFLYTHTAIADVQVFGLPDARLGEIVCAWIKKRPRETLTEEAVREFCQGKIAHYKIPAQIRFVEEFPLTVTGKPQKFRMREMMMAELAEIAAVAEKAGIATVAAMAADI